MAKKIQLTYSLHTLNVISLVLAVVVIGLCLWLRYEWDFKHYVYELEAENILWTGPYILIASSSMTMATAVIGFWATSVDNFQFIPLFALASALPAVLGMAGLAYTLDHGIYHSKLTPWVEERFWVLFHEMDYNERSARILRIIQEDLGCCGPSDWKDYQTFNKVLPDECRDPATGNIAGNGCAEDFARSMEIKTGWLSGFALLLVANQIGSIFVSLRLRKLILLDTRKDKRPYQLVNGRSQF